MGLLPVPAMQAMVKAADGMALAPRPLALHLAVQNLTLAGSLYALPSLKSGSIGWKASLSPRASDLRKRLEDVDADAFKGAVENEIKARLTAFAAGVDAFRREARAPSPPPLPAVWSEGTTRLLRAEADGPPVVLIPSLVNRARILDLEPDRSLVRFLADAGLDAYLVDWDGPGELEKTFDIAAYVERLTRVLDFVSDAHGRPAVVGYCMGGNLALALTARNPGRIAKLALLATPWDFSAMPAPATTMLRASMPALRGLIDALGVLPVDIIQAMFASLDPGGTVRKFRQFAALEPGSADARAFVRLEDWLNDGVPLAGPVALECLERWYLENATMAGAWPDAAHPVRPSEIDVPTLVMIPEGDVIVPPASARPLGLAMANARIVDVDAGHIGMVAGSKAREKLYEPLAAWLMQPKRSLKMRGD